MAAACPRLSVCLSVPQSYVWCSGPCLVSAVHPEQERRAAAACRHAGARRIPSTVTGQGSLRLCSQLPGGVSSGGAAWEGMGVSLPRG